jgi:hypothetical protein
MPTFRHGKSAQFSLDNGAATPVLTDISSYIQDVGFNRQLDMGEVTAIGNSAKAFITGLQDASISISGKFDATMDANIQTAITNLQNGTISSLNWTYKANSSATSSTNPAYSGVALIKTYDVKTAVGDVVSFSLELQVSGAITRATS